MSAIMTSSLRYDENDSFELGADDLTAYGEWRGCCPALSQIPGRERLDVGWRDGRNRVRIQAATQRLEFDWARVRPNEERGCGKVGT